MAVAMDAHLVARRHDLGGERRSAPHLLADEEERRAHAAAVQGGERRGRALRVGAVVEGQRDGAGSATRLRTPSARRSPGDHAHRAGPACSEAGCQRAGGQRGSIVASTHVPCRRRRRGRVCGLPDVQPRRCAAGARGARDPGRGWAARLADRAPGSAPALARRHRARAARMAAPGRRAAAGAADRRAAGARLRARAPARPRGADARRARRCARCARRSSRSSSGWPSSPPSPRRPPTQHVGSWPLAAALAALAAVALAPYVLRGRRDVGGIAAALSAGAAFAWSGLSTKFVADAVHGHHWPAAAGWTVATGLSWGSRS